ncbi:hypothetical protein BCR44DRAFT_1500036 [Catenaria anguillulae PL171]|uniref:Vacuolar protein-sorting-associated protein 36 n=1 Tax=Catenaria anguillulae PL171 TaxID=765915 RepID=A0A1Y2HMB2_9FUNG|nr:hypothetical protein BCR44DRAFT_1500036 [Catenaria anguillulae PL171]
MHPWHSVTLSAAGRVPLDQNESLARVQARVGLYSADFRHPHPLDNGSARDIRQSSLSQGFLRSSPKITLHVQSPSNSTSAATPDKPKPLPQLPWTCHVCQHAHLLPANSPATPSPTCSMCGTSLDIPPTSPAANGANGANAGGATITCTRCTLINPLSAASCAAAASAMDPTGVVMIKLSFRGGGEKGFHQSLLAAMRARAWDADQASSLSPSSSLPTSRPAAGGGGLDSPMLTSSSSSPSPTVKPLGLSGIVAKQEQEQLTQQSALSTAFSDLDALMSKAQDMVTLSSTIAAKLKRSTNSSSSSTDTTPDSLISEFRTYLLSLGATSTLAGSEWPPWANAPQATTATMFEAVGVGVRARQLESGARVVHTERFEDARVFAELTRWLTEGRGGAAAGAGAGGWVGLSALEVAERLGGGVSVALARQLLEHAVRAGVVVVDVPGGRYYVNVWNDQVVGKQR